MNNIIEKYLNLALATPFPYKNFSDASLLQDFKALLNTTNSRSTAGLKLIEHFHKTIWRCNKAGYKSPLDAWQDPLLLYRVIENRFKYLKTDALTPFQIRSGFSHSGKAPKVSIFKPAFAKYLIQKYLNNYTTIFDPCAGFSGRMLGAAALNKAYVGQDINSMTIKESLSIRDFLGLSATLTVADSIYNKGTYDCLFTCPPYGAKENWAQDIEILSTDDWLETCLANYKCDAYLFVVDKTKKYDKFIVEDHINSSHFGTNTESVLLIKN